MSCTLGRIRTLLGGAMVALLLAAPPARAADVAGSKDYPLVGRYVGSEISVFKHFDFDEALLLNGAWTGEPREKSPEWLKLEGRIQVARYEVPQDRSSLEIYRNLVANLDKNGFQPLFECADDDCVTPKAPGLGLLGIELGRHYLALHGDVDTFGHARYRLAKLARPEGDVYVSLLVGESDKGGAGVWQQVVELKGMEGDKIVVIGAAEMQKSLSATGHVALYGINFDTDKDVPKPESKAALDEIAKLLKANPALKLVVVGHTDNQGGYDHNIDLSKRRAANVAKSLVQNYAVAADRLLAFGAGMAAPASSNEDEAGRAKNRRVELVQR